MTIAISAGLVVLGLLLLVGGGELLVRGAVRFALLSRVSPAVVGVTIVAMGTSAPELVVSLMSAWQGTPDLAMGNVVGSNIFNITLILGMAALIVPLKVLGNTVRFEWPVMLFAAIQLHLLGRDGQIDRVEAGFLVLCAVAFVAYTVWIARSQATPAEVEELSSTVEDPPPRRGTSWAVGAALTAGGLLLLVGGAQALVTGAVDLARVAGVPEVIIGLTLIAVGTSLPELFTSVIAAVRGQADIAIGNVVGSNIFNILGILGITGLIVPLPVDAAFIARDNLWMIGVSALLFPIMLTGLRVSRVEGGVLLALALGYATLLAL